MTRDEILAEIRRTATENGGRPLGRNRFADATGISERDWIRYWPRLGDAQREAGFEPNELNAALEHEVVMEKLVGLVRELGKIPTAAEMKVKRYSDPDFPSHNVFSRYGRKPELIDAIRAYSHGRPGHGDIVELCESASHTSRSEGTPADDTQAEDTYGFVYLMRGHRGEYKIGFTTTLPEVRLAQLQVGSAAPLTLVHTIKTDDPTGIERYWHKRFEQRQMQSEWFRLNASEVRAFKRWRRIA